MSAMEEKGQSLMRMKPIFIFLAAVATLLGVYAWSLGWRLHAGRQALDQRRDRGEVVSEAEASAVGEIIGPHFVWSMLAGVVTCLVHSLVLTYFLGTGKAIQDQIDRGRFDESYNTARRRLMAQAVIPATAGIVLIAVGAFSGGFALITRISPAAHLIIASIGVVGQWPIYLREFVIIHENGKLLDRMVDQLGEDIRLTV
jgi:hypothetical protein